MTLSVMQGILVGHWPQATHEWDTCACPPAAAPISLSLRLRKDVVFSFNLLLVDIDCFQKEDRFAT